MRRILLLLLLTAVSAFGQTPEEIIARVNAAHPAGQDLRLDFTQTRHTALMEKDLVSTGSLAFSAPDRLRWENKTPYRNLFILNGTRVLSESARGRTVTDIADSRRFLSISRNIRKAAAGPFVNGKDFDIRVLTNDREWILQLVPTGRDLGALFREIVLHAEPGTGIIRQAVLIDINGDSTTLDFKNLQVGQPLAADLFKTE